MLKHGKFRAFRNIPVGWLLQAIHSTDLSERIFRIGFEGFMLFLVWFVWFEVGNASIIAAFVFTHSVCWMLTGNFWVYMLDSFSSIKNPGIKKLIVYLIKIQKSFAFFNCCDAILIYGSMCRNQFHIRSDLDLRVVRRSDAKYGILALVIGLAFRAYSFFKIIPVDLQVVDSLSFLRHQMRPDEKPIIVYQRPEANLILQGRDFDTVLLDPNSVMKNNV